MAIIAPYKRTYTAIAYFLGQHQSLVPNYVFKNIFHIHVTQKKCILYFFT